MTRDLIREEIKAEDLLERTNTRREFTERLLDGIIQLNLHFFSLFSGIFTGRRISSNYRFRLIPDPPSGHFRGVTDLVELELELDVHPLLHSSERSPHTLSSKLK